MKKNVASQSIGSQMTTAADGTNFTGTVTVYVTGDNGSQTLGSVGSGVCTHEGNGYHSYAPAQAETNYDHIAFTFIGTGAISSTVQVFTTFPQTGDNFARLGSPAGASVSADIAAIKAETASILADTAEIGAAGAGLTALASQTSVNTIDDFLDTEIAAIKAKTDQLTFTVANQVDSNMLTATAEVAVAAGGIASTSFAAGAIDNAAIAANAIGASELAQDAAQEIADEVLNRNLAGGGSGNTRNVRNALRSLRNRAGIAAGTLTVYEEDDTTPAWTAAVTTTAGDPLSEVDPA